MNPLIYNFDQYSRLDIRLNILCLLAVNLKTNSKLEKTFHKFVELIETNPLML